MSEYRKLMEDAKEISKILGALNNTPQTEGNEKNMDISGIAAMAEMMKSLNTQPSNSSPGVRTKLFDEDMIPQNVKMLKAMVPFMDKGQAKNIAVAVKLIELFSVIEKYDENIDVFSASVDVKENAPARQLQMLNAVREYIDKDSRQMIDMFIKIFTMSEMLKSQETFKGQGEANSIYGRKL